MAIRRFLAMTAAEFLSGAPLPSGVAWMACHFSPYTTGLSNLPDLLPSGSLLILNDRTPISGHDPRSIELQLQDCLEVCCCQAVLLDLQRPGFRESAALAEHLVSTLPCPVGVSHWYAGSLPCPVFLPPPPHHIPLQTYLQPWNGREVWLEMALDGEQITLTEEGAEISPCPAHFPWQHKEPSLHCHYAISLSPHRAEFLLRRTREDLEALLAEAEQLGVTTAVGLYQELQDSAGLP